MAAGTGAATVPRPLFAARGMAWPHVGRPTNGSVLGSQFFDLPDGGQVQVPTGSIEMLNGRTLEGKGVMPDIEVYPTLAELQAGKDPALERAEAVLANMAAVRH